VAVDPGGAVQLVPDGMPLRQAMPLLEAVFRRSAQVGQCRLNPSNPY
jgi:hypothetical protein